MPVGLGLKIPASILLELHTIENDRNSPFWVITNNYFRIGHECQSLCEMFAKILSYQLYRSAKLLNGSCPDLKCAGDSNCCQLKLSFRPRLSLVWCNTCHHQAANNLIKSRPTHRGALLLYTVVPLCVYAFSREGVKNTAHYIRQKSAEVGCSTIRYTGPFDPAISPPPLPLSDQSLNP